MMNLYNLDTAYYSNRGVINAVRTPNTYCFILIDICGPKKLSRIGKETCYGSDTKLCKIHKRGVKTRKYYKSIQYR